MLVTRTQTVSLDSIGRWDCKGIKENRVCRAQNLHLYCSYLIHQSTRKNPAVEDVQSNIECNMIGGSGLPRIHEKVWKKKFKENFINTQVSKWTLSAVTVMGIEILSILEIKQALSLFLSLSLSFSLSVSFYLCLCFFPYASFSVFPLPLLYVKNFSVLGIEPKPPVW